MLEITADKVAEIIILAREGDRGDREFDAFIDGLNADEQVALVALMWIGRGTFDAGEIEEALETARQEASTPTKDYLRGTPHLADHLESGLEAIGIDALAEEDALY